MITLEPIGVVESPFRESAQIPKGPGAQHSAEGYLSLLPELEAGLADIEGFSHLYVIWVFHRTEGYDLTAYPPSDDRPHGVFATRSPRRPNPIGLTVVELLGRDGARLHVRGLDMLDGTPILDIKPYLSSIPADQLRRGWLAEAEARGRMSARGTDVAEPASAGERASAYAGDGEPSRAAAVPAAPASPARAAAAADPRSPTSR